MYPGLGLHFSLATRDDVMGTHMFIPTSDPMAPIFSTKGTGISFQDFLSTGSSIRLPSKAQIIQPYTFANIHLPRAIARLSLEDLIT